MFNNIVFVLFCSIQTNHRHCTCMCYPIFLFVWVHPTSYLNQFSYIQLYTRFDSSSGCSYRSRKQNRIGHQHVCLTSIVYVVSQPTNTLIISRTNCNLSFDISFELVESTICIQWFIMFQFYITEDHTAIMKVTCSST